MKYSKQREIIYQTLVKNPVHPTAEELHQIITKNNPEIGIATVYRNLKKLVSEGLVKRITVPGNKDHYDATMWEHYHLYCVRCNNLTDIPNSYSVKLNYPESLTTDYNIINIDVNINYICKECLNKEKE